MKFNPSFQLRNICGEHVMVPTGAEFVDFNKLITLNETALDIYQEFAEKDFQAADVEAFLLSHYEGIDAQTVVLDVAQLFADFLRNGLIMA